jgi:hypothetical protein
MTIYIQRYRRDRYTTFAHHLSEGNRAAGHLDNGMLYKGGTIRNRLSRRKGGKKFSFHYIPECCSWDGTSIVTLALNTLRCPEFQLDQLIIALTSMSERRERASVMNTATEIEIERGKKT